MLISAAIAGATRLMQRCVAARAASTPPAGAAHAKWGGQVSQCASTLLGKQRKGPEAGRGWRRVGGGVAAARARRDSRTPCCRSCCCSAAGAGTATSRQAAPALLLAALARAADDADVEEEEVRKPSAAAAAPVQASNNTSAATAACCCWARPMLPRTTPCWRARGQLCVGFVAAGWVRAGPKALETRECVRVCCSVCIYMWACVWEEVLCARGGGAE